jgi:hypothetical protein
VGDQQRGLAKLLLDLRYLGAEQQSRLFVERGEWFIHQQNLRPRGQRPRDGDALAHAARQLSRMTTLETLQADHCNVVTGVLQALGAGDATQFERECDIVDHAAPGECAFLLKHHADGWMWAGDRLAGDRDAALIVAGQSADDVKQSGFAATGRTDE